MKLSFSKIQPNFGAEVSAVDLREVHDRETLSRIRAAMDEYAVLVFHNQPFTNEEQLAFAQRFDGKLHTGGSRAVLFGKNRHGYVGGITDVANVNDQGETWAADDRRRLSVLSNCIWHTDASYQEIPGRYSMLSARVVPPVRADTQFADMRGAYDALDDAMKARIDGLQALHSSTRGKELLGFTLTPEELARSPSAVQPLVRTLPRSGRRALYLAMHAAHIVGMPVPEGRVLLYKLTEHATQPQFVYSHDWRAGDFVIWDNRATMHRLRPYEDTKHRRELVRTTTLDLPYEFEAAAVH
jgi:alpha-ketoglutarate-dependent 2,4-dichlorophenoxyacetate dioxygenase